MLGGSVKEQEGGRKVLVSTAPGVSLTLREEQMREVRGES
jgi:hypothetical protein